jgi:uncharacterized protein YndB with AHSA1/START domain
LSFTGGGAEVARLAPFALAHFAAEQQIFLPAPPARAWAAFTLEIDHWWTYRLRDRTRCTIEPFVGGRWMQEWDNGGALFGNFTVWDPPRLLMVVGPLAMTRPAHNLLEFHFEPTDGGTQVLIRHEAYGVFDDDTEEMYANGWRDLIGGALHAHLSR